jgi:hypothetical protein
MFVLNFNTRVHNMRDNLNLVICGISVLFLFSSDLVGVQPFHPESDGDGSRQKANREGHSASNSFTPYGAQRVELVG